MHMSDPVVCSGAGVAAAGPPMYREALLHGQPAHQHPRPPPPRPVVHGGCAARRVRFAPQNQTLLFVATRPPSLTCLPIYHLQVVPKNCSARLGRADWLSSIQLMRSPPYARLDYLRVAKADLRPPGDIFCLDDDDGAPATSEHSLTGEVAVFNLDYAKEVLVHYTFDGWRGKQVSTGRYLGSIGTLRIDKFKFTINLPPPSARTEFGRKAATTVIPLQLAIEYRVLGQSHWDNCDCQNYQFDCHLSPIPLYEELPPPPPPPPPLEARTLPLAAAASPPIGALLLRHTSDSPPTRPISIPPPNLKRGSGRAPIMAHTAPSISTLQRARDQATVRRAASSWGPERCPSVTIPRTLSIAF